MLSLTLIEINTVMARLGSAARGDPLYDAGAQLGKLLRPAFLTDYFANERCRGEPVACSTAARRQRSQGRLLFWPRCGAGASFG